MVNRAAFSRAFSKCYRHQVCLVFVLLDLLHNPVARDLI